MIWCCSTAVGKFIQNGHGGKGYKPACETLSLLDILCVAHLDLYEKII